MHPFDQSLRRTLGHACFMVLLSTWAAVVSADDGLTLTILPETSTDGVPVIDIDKPLRVVIMNNTDRKAKIWHPFSRRGYYCLTLESKNLATGELFRSAKRQIDDDAFFETLADHMEPGSNPVTIAPNDTFAIQIELIDFAWGKLEWIGVPEPNTGVKYSIQAVYQVAEEATDEETVWTGRIVSDPLEVRIVSERIDTPHEYLWNSLPNLALRVMKDDPSWINRRDEDSRTPLHVAARFKHLDVVKWLLDNGADVNAIAYNGFTPLHLTSDPEAIKLILEHDPDLSIRCRALGQTPLQRAVARASSARSEDERQYWHSIAKLFLRAGADYDIITAIHLNDLDRVKVILSESPTVDDGFYGNSPLRRAASLGRVEICKHLIAELDTDVDQFDQGSGYPIIKDALAYPEIVRLLIKRGADLERRITWQGGRSGVWIIGDEATALHFAARDGVPETINLLIDAGVDIFANTESMFDDEQTEQTALDVAAYFGKAENAATIVNHPKFKETDADIRQQVLNRCLISAAFSSWLARDADRPALLKVLLNRGADPNATDEDGNTAIQVAAREIHPGNDEENREIMKMISILREHGAKLDLFSAVAVGDMSEAARLLNANPKSANSRGYDGYPALHLSVAINNKGMVELLLEAGGDVEIRNKSDNQGTEGGTPLHAAAFWARDEIAKLLIEHGANVDARGAGQSTPLHSAARMTNVRMARLLLENGAIIDAKDSDGQTPLDWCRELRWTDAHEIEKLLRKYADK